MVFRIIHGKRHFGKNKLLLVTKQAKSLQNLLIRARFDVVPKPIAPQKMLDFTTVRIKCAFFIVIMILTLAKNLNLNLNLADTIFGNTTVILTVKAEM